MNKIDFILLFDVVDANPNGDPDSGNYPRVDPESLQGLVTDVCLKRKIRNYIQLTRGNCIGYDIYVKEKAILNNIHENAYTILEKTVKTPTEDDARKWMCDNFFDVRTFGAVMSTGKKKCGQVRGPVQLSFARSVDCINQQDFTITRCAVTTQESADTQNGENRTMGSKFTVPYALYVAKGTVNPFLAEQTGFSDEDLKVLIESITHMFDFDASAARPAGSMAVRKLILFRHSSQLGNAPAHKLYGSLSITRKEGVEYARSISDYDIIFNEDNIPEGVKAECVEC